MLAPELAGVSVAGLIASDPATGFVVSLTTTVAVAVAVRPVESVTVTVPVWLPLRSNVCCTVRPVAVAPSSKRHA